jgi:CDP-6-deoxy-D-xylo-4-hexulose-3-dehydrase
LRYPLSSLNSISKAAIEAGVESLRSGRYTMGPKVQQFEQDFAAWVGAKHAVMVNSGSSANLLAVEALMRGSQQAYWKAGDEVLVPALAWSTTVAPLVQLGLVPVFVDSDPETLAMDFRHAETLVSERTVGVFLIHVLGLAADLVQATTFCEKHHLVLIEDCCEAFGAHFRGLSVGTTGLVGTFSHFFSHQLTTMEGGTIITEDDAIADDLRSMRAHGWSRDRLDKAQWSNSEIDPSFCFVTTGHNVRPLEVQGAIGIEQLKEADVQLEKRVETADRFVDLLEDEAPWLRVIGKWHANDLYVGRKWCTHTWMNMPLLVEAFSPVSKAQVLQQFHAAGIETRPILAGNFVKHPVMRTIPHYRVSPTGYPVANRVMRDGFMIGCHPDPGGLEALHDALTNLRKAA